MPWVEKEGRTVEEARAAAVAALGLPEEEVEVEVIREGVRGLFGLGGETALVRARPRSEAPDVREAFTGYGPPPAASGPPPEAVATGPLPPPAPAGEATSASAPEDRREAVAGRPAMDERQRVAAEVGVEMVKGILQRMGLKGEVRSRVEGATVYVEVFGEEMGILIGRGGKTLEALQELVRAGVQRRLKARTPLVVDVEAYWERRRHGRREGGGTPASNKAS